MKTIQKYSIFIVLLSLCFSKTSKAQVLNLAINDSTIHFTTTSGKLMSFRFNLPEKDTADGEVWIDINHNETIENETDVELYQFQIIDNNPSGGTEGHPDLDGTDGRIFTIAIIGFAPEHYVFKFTNNNLGESIPGIILPVANPAYTISGNVTPPFGISKHFILLRAKIYSGNSTALFWNAITDTNGNYTIQLGNETANNRWKVRIDKEFNGYNSVPQDSIVMLNGNITGINFSFTPQTSVGENNSFNPNTFTLSQNYPNPFNPTTVISYQLKVKSIVSLKIYNILSEEVATLVNQEMNIGNYTATWNATNIPSGMYFYRLTSNTFSETKKMILMK